MALFQTSLWSSGFGMKLEAVTPFLGKYRPFVGRCCQTCTPKSWVSDGQARPYLGKLGSGSHSCRSPGKQFPSCLPSPALPQPVVFQGNGCSSVCWLVVWACSWLLAPRPGRVGWGGTEGSERPEGWGLSMPALRVEGLETLSTQSRRALGTCLGPL